VITNWKHNYHEKQRQCGIGMMYNRPLLYDHMKQ